MGPRAGLDRCGKSRLTPAFDPRTVQPVAGRYTDWATAVHCSELYIQIIRTVIRYLVCLLNFMLLACRPKSAEVARNRKV